MEGGNAFNALNFNLAEYNDACGSNYTGASQVVAVFLCPSSTRQPDGGRDGSRPQRRPFSALSGTGYGYNDYGPTVYTDISPLGRRRTRVATPATPYRDKTTRANGLLKQGKTANRRDHRRHQQHHRHRRRRRPRPPLPQPLHRGILEQACITRAGRHGRRSTPIDPGPAGGYTPYRRFWRWAEPDEGFGVSGTPNNKYRPDHEAVDWPHHHPVRRPGQ